MTQKSHSQAYTLWKPMEKDTYIPLFIAALFTITRTQKQPRCPSIGEWIKKAWYIYTIEYYSAIKRNTFEPVLMRWMNPEPIIQSEVSQKEKDKYHILMHIYRIQKNGTKYFIYRAAMEKQTQRTDLWTHRWGEERQGGMNGKSNMETDTLSYVKQRANRNFLYDLDNSNRSSVTTQRGGMRWEAEGRLKREGTQGYLWLIHVEVQWKPTKYFKTIILQLKINKKEII